MADQDPVRLHAELGGRVQGVGFRYFVLRNATDLNIAGWVRNRWRGTVEVVAEGNRPILDRFLVALKRGPSGSLVTSVDVQWGAATGEFTRFQVRGTA